MPNHHHSTRPLQKIFLSLLLLGAIFGGASSPSHLAAQNVFMKPLPVSPARLMESYQKDFHQADAMYTGKLLLLTGRIKTITPAQRVYNQNKDKIYAYLTMDTGRNLPVAIYLWDWEAERINALRTGSTITVMGFCQGVPPQLSILDACIYPAGCGGPKADFNGPYYETPPTPPPPIKAP